MATVNEYSYNFGIDSVVFSHATTNSDMCFVSDKISIGTLDDDGYIQLSSEYNTGGNGSVEFYILDGSEVKPILPIETEIVIDEKIFYGLNTRFSIDEDNKVTIKKNGIPLDITLSQAINTNDSGYTITYTPLNPYKIELNNATIRIKVILRTYDTNLEAPFVKSMSINKYGGTFI
jgi:hypothetical protein